MSFTTLATANSTIGPAQYADMAQALAPRVLVDTPNDLRPSFSGGAVVVQAGAALVCGIRVRSSVTHTLPLPVSSATAGEVQYVVALRIDWSLSSTEAAGLVYFPWPAGGASRLINTTSTPDDLKLNRIPGVVYDAVLARVTVGVATGQPNALVDLRMWGGDGGPLSVGEKVVGLDNEYLRLLDARVGTFISTPDGSTTLRFGEDQVWRPYSLGSGSEPGSGSDPGSSPGSGSGSTSVEWERWTPTLRYYGTGQIDGSTGGTPVKLGTPSAYSGHYRVVGGMLEGFARLTTGKNYDFGTGPITMDLPLPCASWIKDTWSQGHIYMDKTSTQSKVGGVFDWHAELRVQAGWKRGQIYAPISEYGPQLLPHKASRAGAAAQGVPLINDGFSVGSIYTFHVSYPVDEAG